MKDFATDLNNLESVPIIAYVGYVPYFQKKETLIG